MILSRTDVWLSLLWRQCGRSWARLERRLAEAPGAREKLAAARRFRARLDARHHGAPRRPPPVGPNLDDLEAAIQWLAEPGSAPEAPSPADEEMTALDTEILVARLARTFPRMPRREMEELLRRGPVVLPAVLDALASARPYPGPGDALWAIVLLGELRHPDAIAALGSHLTDTGDGATVAAAEALAKIGPPAVPLLVARTARPAEIERLLAYSALGHIPTDDAHQCLLDALARDIALLDVIASALARHQRRTALEPLHACALTAPRRLRRAVEQAIAALAHGLEPRDPFDDWRLRYRRLPRLGWNFPPTATAIAALAHRRCAPVSPSPRRGAAPRSLTDILADARLRPDPPRCPHCAGRVWHPTGLPVCLHTARPTLALQRTVLARWLAEGVTDVWTALDDCDAMDCTLAAGRPTPRTRRERDIIAVGRATLYWLASLQRADTRMDIRTGSKQLALVADDLGRLYGDSTPIGYALRSGFTPRPSKFS